MKAADRANALGCRASSSARTSSEPTFHKHAGKTAAASSSTSPTPHLPPVRDRYLRLLKRSATSIPSASAGGPRSTSTATTSRRSTSWPGPRRTGSSSTRGSPSTRWICQLRRGHRALRAASRDRRSSTPRLEEIRPRGSSSSGAHESGKTTVAVQAHRGARGERPEGRLAQAHGPRLRDGRPGQGLAAPRGRGREPGGPRGGAAGRAVHRAAPGQPALSEFLEGEYGLRDSTSSSSRGSAARPAARRSRCVRAATGPRAAARERPGRRRGRHRPPDGAPLFDSPLRHSARRPGSSALLMNRLGLERT